MIAIPVFRYIFISLPEIFYLALPTTCFTSYGFVCNFSTNSATSGLEEADLFFCQSTMESNHDFHVFSFNATTARHASNDEIIKLGNFTVLWSTICEYFLIFLQFFKEFSSCIWKFVLLSSRWPWHPKASAPAPVWVPKGMPKGTVTFFFQDVLIIGVTSNPGEDVRGRHK